MDKRVRRGLLVVLLLILVVVAVQKISIKSPEQYQKEQIHQEVEDDFQILAENDNSITDGDAKPTEEAGNIIENGSTSEPSESPSVGAYPGQNATPTVIPSTESGKLPTTGSTKSPQLKPSEAPTPSASKPSAKPSAKPSHEDEYIICYITIDCSVLIDGEALRENGNENKLQYVPQDGKILSRAKVRCKKGLSVYDVLKKICKKKNIQMEASYTAGFDTYYVEGISHLYELEAGTGSGWVFAVNGIMPNYGASDYEVYDGDEIVWMYTLNYGFDVTP